MSGPFNLEFLRKEAKSLLKQIRAGDTDAIKRIRNHLPRLAELDDARIRETIKLADVHHALARESGHGSWGDLKRGDSLVDQFLVAIRGNSFKDAQRVLTILPEIASESIHCACAVGDPHAVERHLNHTPSLLNTEHGGWTPLFYACGSLLGRVSSRQSAGILESATLLLDKGADPNTFVLTDPSDPESKLSSARRAMMSGNMPLVMLLIQRGARPDLQKWASTVLQRQPGIAAAFREHFGSRDVSQHFEQWIEKIREQQGQGPLWGADKWWFHMRAEPPMMYASMLVPFLKGGSLDPNKAGLDGFTMFHRAARDGTVEVIELLLDHGADIHRLTSDGKTALVLALRAGKNLNVDLLRARGATATGVRPIDELIGACVRADAQTAQAILKAHPLAASNISVEDMEVLVRSAAMNILDRVKFMLSCGFDPGSPGEAGITALHAAAWHGHLEMVRLLLGFHASVNSRDLTYGSSPLAWAAHGSRHKPNAEDDYGAIIEALLEAGADYECAVSRSGVRPEELATERVARAFKRRTS